MLTDNIEEIKGIGQKYKNVLNNAGIYTKKDLILLAPTSYNIYKKIDINTISFDMNITIDILVEGALTTISKVKCLLFYATSNAKRIKVMAFGMDYLRYKLKKGFKYTIFGLYKPLENTFYLKQLFNDDFKEFIEPVYSIKISNKILGKAIKGVFDESIDIKTDIPESILKKNNIEDYNKFLYDMHFPNDEKDISKITYVNDYLKYLEYNVRLVCLKYYYDTFIKKPKDIDSNKIEEFISKLEFELTKDQREAIFDTIKDMKSNHLLNRLIQGDVGSGKTIVAFTALYANYLSGYMGCLMVPSEVLSVQHYQKALKLFEKYNIRIRLLNGDIRRSERAILKEDIKNGNVDILIGTHALFSDDIVYNNLGLVVIDEQHRFGVMQRQALINKGIMADSLFLTATPIPRTLGISKCLDLDISTITTRPLDRKKILTKVVKTKDEDFIINAIQKNVSKGHQIFIVTPLILESVNEELYTIDKVVEIIKNRLPNVKIGTLNGAMKNKDCVMDKFARHEFDVLISTTVIEVGIDISNATLMIIYNAERFGLSTLHQLRGRVGRNNLICGCILVSDKDSNRLSIMESCDDCFTLSEMDLKIRGYGEILGFNQSGFKKLKIDDEKAFIESREDARRLYQEYLEGSNSKYVSSIIDLENKVNKLN